MKFIARKIVSILVNNVKQLKEKTNMASFNDYLKEIDNLKQQVKTDKDNLKLRIEQLYNFKGFYGDNFKYLTGSLHSALHSLEDCVDMMEGWIPVIEKDIPEDEKFLSEMELKAKAFDKVLEAWRGPEDDFIDKMDKIMTETIYSADCEPDPELDKEPEVLPECEDDAIARVQR